MMWYAGYTDDPRTEPITYGYESENDRIAN